MVCKFVINFNHCQTVVTCPLIGGGGVGLGEKFETCRRIITQSEILDFIALSIVIPGDFVCFWKNLKWVRFHFSVETEKKFIVNDNYGMYGNLTM